MNEKTLHDRTPEELLLEAGEARGLVVRLHRLSWFLIEMVAVVGQGESVRVVRREMTVGPRGVVAPKCDDEFACRPCLLAKFDRQLARLGVAEIKPFAAQGGLGGTSVVCRYRDPWGAVHRVHLFGWNESRNRETRRLGDFLEHLARSPLPTLRRQAWVSRFW